MMSNRIISEIAKNQQQIENRIVVLSERHGGAWIYSVKAFTNEVEYKQYKSPSAVPDRCFDAADGIMGWKGQIVLFTAAARIRK